MLLELELLDVKAAPTAPRVHKVVNTRYIAEIDPVYEPASEDDQTGVRAGSTITMHSGKKYRVAENVTQLINKIGGRA